MGVYSVVILISLTALVRTALEVGFRGLASSLYGLHMLSSLCPALQVLLDANSLFHPVPPNVGFTESAQMKTWSKHIETPPTTGSLN